MKRKVDGRQPHGSEYNHHLLPGAGCVGKLLEPSLVEGFWQVQWNKTGQTHIYRVGTMTTSGARAYDLQVCCDMFYVYY